MTELTGFVVNAHDGAIGKVTSVYFDDQSWTVRFLVVEADDRKDTRFVLIAPQSVICIRWAEGAIDVSLSRREIVSSPKIDTNKPVARQHELDGSAYCGQVAVPAFAGTTPDAHLRGSAQVIGYQVIATDHASGHVADFLFDAQGWTIPSLLADVHEWLPSKRVVLAIDIVSRISWSTRKVYVSATRDAIHAARSYDARHAFS